MLVRSHLRPALALSIAAIAAAPATAKDAAKIAIRPESQDAAIIIKTDDLPPPPGYKTSYRINLQVYDPEAKTMRGGPFGGQATIAARPKAFVGGYLVVDLKPGTYAFRDFSRQDFWALCFNEASLQFTVKAGEVLYLGELDSKRLLTELVRLAVSTGQVRTRGKPVHFFDGVSPPSFAPVDEAGLAAAAAMMKARMPQTTVAPKAATFAPARFGTGSDLFGMSRICGGYYQKRAK